MEQNVKTNKEAGFTLIELLLVILIISILTSIATLIYSNFQNQATTDLVWFDLKVIRAAARMYYMDYQTFPPDIQTLVDKSYLDEMPKDKFAPESPYKFKFISANSFQEWSVGPNGQDNGGAGDDLSLTFGP